MRCLELPHSEIENQLQSKATTPKIAQTSNSVWFQLLYWNFCGALLVVKKRF